MPETSRLTWRKKKTSALPTRRLLLFLVGLMLLSFSLPPFFNFPVLKFWLIPLGVIYLGLLAVSPRLWLYVLPFAAISVDLSPITGRSLYNEFDFLVLLTLANGLLFNRYRFEVYKPTMALAVVLFFLVFVALGYRDWSAFFAPPRAEMMSYHLSPHFSYMTLKGLLWGLLLVPMWGYLLGENKLRATQAFVIGMLISAILLAAGTLYDVLVAHNLLGQQITELQQKLALQSQFSTLQFSSKADAGFALLFTPALLYAVFQGNKMLRTAGMIGLGLIGSALILRADAVTLLWVVTAMVGYALLSVRTARQNAVSASIPRGPWYIAGLFLIASAAIAIQSSDRITADETPDGTTLPWQALATATDSSVFYITGNGVGQLPAKYLKTHPSQRSAAGSYAIAQGDAGQVIQLTGGDDVYLGQRVPVIAFTDYKIELQLRTKRNAVVELSLCELPVAIGHARCKTQTLRLRNNDGAFYTVTTPINSVEIGRRNFIGSHDTLLVLHSPTAGNTLEIDSVSLATDDFNLLGNGSFERGLDRWFHYAGDKRPPWIHATLLQRFVFELGLLGTASLLVIAGFVFRNLLQKRSTDSLNPVYAIAVLTILSYGLIADPIVAPRTAWLFWFFVGAGVAQLKRSPRKRASSGKPAI